MGGAVCVRDSKTVLVMFNGLTNFGDEKKRNKWRNKMKVKLRYRYRLKKIPYCGYYYFGLNDKRLAMVLAQKAANR
jgi:hypothetical protein